MNIRRIAGLTLVLLVTAPAWPATAGGGGCHEQTEGTGSSVVIADACFQPSLLHTEPGTSVRFFNKDDFEHNVYGSGWAIGDLPGGSGGDVTFDDEGLYPFQCSIHPGMTGVVIVGDGDGPGNGAAVTVDLGDAAPPAADAAVDTSSATSAAADDGTSWLPAGVLGLLVGLGLGVGAMALAASSTRRRESAAITSSA